MFYIVLLLFLASFHVVFAINCINLDVAVTQKVENEGFHREVRWLVEILSPNVYEVKKHNCSLVLRIDVNRGMFVSPDQIADLVRLNQISAYIDGDVNVESIAHESEEHTVFVFLNVTSDKVLVTLPVHLRYQRAQITGGYSKVTLPKPSLLIKCDDIDPCGKTKKLNGPCDISGKVTCLYRNFTYDALFEEVELYVPIGNLDDYPFVSVITLLLGCAGCIYILSLLSMAPL